MHYRIYQLGLDDHIKKGHDIDCSSDLEALAEIAHIVGPSPAELWCGTRRVGRWTPQVGIEVTDGDWAGAETAVA